MPRLSSVILHVAKERGSVCAKGRESVATARRELRGLSLLSSASTRRSDARGLRYQQLRRISFESTALGLAPVIALSN